MAHLSVQLWAHPDAATPVPLPEFTSVSVSPTEGDAGSVELAYTPGARGFDTLFAVTEDDVDVEVEITLRDGAGGSWVDRAILDEVDGDDIENSGEWKFTGRLLSCLLDEVVVPYHPGGENGETAVSGKAGRIARDLLEAAQARGCLAGVTWSFTDTHDSDGNPWAYEGTFSLSPGQTYRAVLGSLRGYQLAEWSLLPTRELRLVNPDGNGVDRTVGANPLTLERGRDLGDAPRRHTVREAVTDLLTSGKDGLYSAASNLTARARRGRVIEGYKSFGNAADQGTLDALTQAQLGTQVEGRLELSHKLALGPGHPTPLIDFLESDYVFSATRSGVARRRVKQLRVQVSAEGSVEASVTLNALIDEALVRQQQRIDDLASGAVVVGTSTPPPDVDDGSTPAAPTGLVASSLWYSTGEGVGLDSITAAWSAVPDGTVVGYVVEWRYSGGVLDGSYQRLAQVTGTSVSWSAVAPGEQLQVRVYAANRYGRFSPASSVYTFTTELDGTPPPVASAPTPYASLGLLVVPWDGRGVSSAPMPQDFYRAEVHVSATSGFTPNRPLLASGKLNEATSTTYAGELRANGELPIDIGTAFYGTTFYVKLVLVDRSNNAAAASAQGSAVLAPVQDGEIATLSIGKLRAGILSAIMTVSGKITTSTTGAGWEGDSAGFRFYDGTRTAILEFIAASGVLQMMGKFIAGPSATSGNRIIVDPAYTHPGDTAFPTLVLHSSGATKGPARVNATGQTGGTTALGLNSGPSTATAVYEQSTAFMLPDSVTVSVNNGDGGLVSSGWRGGALRLQKTVALLACAPAGAATSQVSLTDGDVSISGNDDVVITAGDDIVLDADGDIYTTIPMGTTGSGFSQRLQGGAAAGVRGAFSGGVMRFVDNQGGGGFMELGGPFGAYKTFVIDHPLKGDRYLVHCTTESPHAGVEYWGEAVLRDGVAQVQLPAYFEPLARLEGRQVQVTPVLDDRCEVHPVAAGRIRLGRFSIASPGAPDGTAVSWLVKAIRADVPELEVEPLRSTSDLHRFGPYTYLADDLAEDSR